MKMVSASIYLFVLSMVICSVRMEQRIDESQQQSTSRLLNNLVASSNSDYLKKADEDLLLSGYDETYNDEDGNGLNEEYDDSLLDRERYVFSRAAAGAPRRIFIGRRAQEDYDSNELSAIDKRNVRRHLFLGKRNSNSKLSALQAKRNGQIHRIFIGKRGDIKRIFIG